jgi:hypothetical protein
MMFAPFFTPWLRLSVDAARLACETQALVGLRLFRIATGAVPAFAEVGRMMPEKAAALSAAQTLAVEGAAAGTGDKVPAKVVALYRDRVKANKTRLSKAGRVSRH